MKRRIAYEHNGVTGSLTVGGAKKKAWAAFARFIRTRDHYCITCHAVTTEAGHFLHNSDKANQQLGGNELWYDEINVNGQCGTCNRWHSGKRDIYAIKLEEKYGHGVLQDLYTKFRTVKKWTIPELLDIEAKYTALLSR